MSESFPPGAAWASSAVLMGAIFDASPDVIYAKDRAGRMLFANPAALALIGKPLAQVLGRTDAEFLDDQAAATAVMDNDRRIMTTGAACEIEERVPLPDGTERIWLSLKTPHCDADGNVVGLLGISRDITESRQLERLREEAQAKLLASEQRLRLAIDSVGAGAYDWDLRTGALMWDERTRELMGAPAEGAVDLDMFYARVHPDDLGGVRASIEKALADPASGASWRHRYRVTRDDEGFRWIDAAGRLQYDFVDNERRAVRFSGLVFDVTERVESAARLKASEQARKQSENRLLQAMSSSSLGWWELNPATGTVYWSPSARRMFDIDVDDKGQFVLDDPVARFHPEDSTRIFEAINAALDPSGDGHYHIQYRVVWRDGTIHWLDAIGDAHFGERDGKRCALYFSGVLWDITEQRQLLESLREADRQKNVFLATLAHELRNPLAPVRSAAQVLAAEGVEPSQVQWSSQIIQRQVGQMAHLLDDLLDISRITQGKLELKKSNVALGTVVDMAVETARPVIDAKGHALSIELPAGAPTLHADALRISQLLSNLLTNAAKYTDAGGRIALRARIEGEELVMTVSDNGIGFAPDSVITLFSMFAQTEVALSRSEGGLGIGLALVKGLAELHGGTVLARSPGAGQGSDFEVRLPLGATSEPEASIHPVVARTDGTCSILVADDNRDAAESLGLLLEMSGHELTLAFDGRAAFDAAARVRPDVALLDIGMPGLTGYELAAALRAEDWGQRIRLIALSGWGQESDKRRAFEAGFDHHLTKPVDADTLDALLKPLD